MFFRAQPHPYTFKTNRVVDPLLPAYKLPSTKMADPAEPKFLRDSYDVSDISGTKSRPLYKFQVVSPTRILNRLCGTFLYLYLFLCALFGLVT